MAAAMVLFGAASLSAQSAWQLVDNEVIVAKKTCIQADDVADRGHGVDGWVTDRYATAVRMGGTDVASARAELDVDCDAGRWTVIQVVTYDARGTIAATMRGDGRPRALNGSSPGADLARGVCSVASIKRSWAAASDLQP